MSFEAERLRILERVSSGELTPQEGSLQIAMLKVRYQEEAPPPPDDDATGVTIGLEGEQARTERPFEEAWRERFARSGLPRDLKLTWPLMLGLALPVLFVMGLGLGALALFLALPALALVLVWNALAPVLPGSWPLLAFWPTLGFMILFFVLWSLLGLRRRARVFIQR